jgi:hypothetical protein
MKTSVRLRGALFALCALLAGALPAHAAVLVGTQGSTFFSLTNDWEVFRTFQPIADVVIGSSDVSIGGFGVFGAAEAAGKISFVVFENDAFLWQSASYDVEPDGPKWYDVDYVKTLVNGSTYTMGVVANNMFAWGQNTESDVGYGPVGGDGIVIMPLRTHAQLDIEQGADFVTEPFLQRALDDTAYQTSVRVFDVAGVPAVPEPAEWSMLVGGLLVVAFVANRRRRPACR